MCVGHTGPDEGLAVRIGLVRWLINENDIGNGRYVDTSGRGTALAIAKHGEGARPLFDDTFHERRCSLLTPPQRKFVIFLPEHTLS